MEAVGSLVQTCFRIASAFCEGLISPPRFVTLFFWRRAKAATAFVLHWSFLIFSLPLRILLGYLREDKIRRQLAQLQAEHEHLANALVEAQKHLSASEAEVERTKEKLAEALHEKKRIRQRARSALTQAALQAKELEKVLYIKDSIPEHHTPTSMPKLETSEQDLPPPPQASTTKPPRKFPATERPSPLPAAADDAEFASCNEGPGESPESSRAPTSLEEAPPQRQPSPPPSSTRSASLDRTLRTERRFCALCTLLDVTALTLLWWTRRLSGNNLWASLGLVLNLILSLAAWSSFPSSTKLHIERALEGAKVGVRRGKGVGARPVLLLCLSWLLLGVLLGIVGVGLMSTSLVPGSLIRSCPADVLANAKVMMRGVVSSVAAEFNDTIPPVSV